MMGHGSRIHKLKKRVRGQISILIVFSLIPLLTLFAFVVNVGMLVNAKISLQNAADLAAYAGAATQARQMSYISFMNYQLRQTYKKFIYKYYVLGNLSQKCFPRGGTPSADCNNTKFQGQVYPFENPGPNSPNFPGIPSVCITLSPDSNPCQLGDIVPVVTTPNCIAGLDPTCDALRNAAQEIAKIQGMSCNANSVVNSEVLAHWLYATDDKGDIQSQAALKGLVEGIGLVPETLLIKERIDTMRGYVNAPPQEVNVAALTGALENDPDPIKFERSVMAFRTVLGNLNTADVFDSESISMKEFLPKTDMLILKEIAPKFQAAYAFMDGGPAGTPPTECGMKLQFITAQPVVGVFKDPSSYVYYAIKLTADAQLLFNPFPFGGSPAPRITLTAYSAAAPFGSRIGPKIDESAFVIEGTARVDKNNTKKVPFPTLPISDAVTSNPPLWNSTEVLRAYRSTLIAAGSNGAIATGSVGTRDLIRGQRAAMLPDQIEVGKYNIPVDTDQIGVQAGQFAGGPEGHEAVPYFRTGNGSDPQFTFWAPVHPIGGQTQFRDKLDNELNNIIGDLGQQVTNSGPLTAARQAIKDSFLQKLDGFLGELRAKNRFNVFAMPDPLAQKFFQANPPTPDPVVTAAGKVIDKVKLASSYTTDHDEFYFANGRVGYSVKYIPFKSLISEPLRVANTPDEKRVVPPGQAVFGGDFADAQELAH